MCQFKSGIILKNRVEFGDGITDSHQDMLESLGIEDDFLGATRTFVRAELQPKNGEWWLNPTEHPEKWEFVVDQDQTPDWFDPEEYEKVFREAVADWWKEHVLVDQKMDELSRGYYMLKRCEVKKLCNDVKVILNDTQVGEMWGSSQVREMWGSSQVGEMRESSQVREMWESSQVREMWESSQVREMWESSQVRVMWGSSQVRVMWGSSQVGVMRGSSQVGVMRGSSQVGVMRGSSQVGEMWVSSQVREMWGSSQVREMWGSSQVGEMRGSSQVGEMWESSQVREMWESSQVGEMRGSSTARDFKNYPDVKIWISEEGKYTMEVHKSAENDKGEEDGKV